jgi:iron complex outermembrane recepter protein
LPQVPGYAVFNAHTSYQIGKQLQVYGLIQNIFNQHYYTYGGLFDAGVLPLAARRTSPIRAASAPPCHSRSTRG